MLKAVLFNDTSNENHLGSTQVVNNIRILCAKYNITLAASYHREDINEQNLGLKRKLKSSDLVIINGEGTLHRSTPYARNFLEICRDKRSILINTVWEKMYIKDEKLLRNIILVSVRESLSYAQIIKTFDKRKVHIVPDLIFYTGLGFLKQKIGYSDSYMDYLRDGLRKNRNYFPMDYAGSNPDLEAYVTWMSGLDLYVTGRFHGVCLAAMVNKPFLAFPTNSHKMEGLLKDMRCPELLIESFEEIRSKQAQAKRSVVKAHNYALKAKEEIEDFFKLVKSKI